MKLTDAIVSDCDCVRKSRLRSKPLPLARVPATRPSGFWIGLKTRIAWLRIASIFGSVPYGVVAYFSIVSIAASTPSNSLPWMPPWMKTGTLMRLPKWRASDCAAIGERSISARTVSQLA